MRELRLLAEGYLEANGYRVVDQDQHGLIFDKLVFGQDRDTVLLWTVPDEHDIGQWESVLRREIPKRRANYPDAKAYVLASSCTLSCAQAKMIKIIKHRGMKK